MDNNFRVKNNQFGPRSLDEVRRSQANARGVINQPTKPEVEKAVVKPNEIKDRIDKLNSFRRETWK